MPDGLGQLAGDVDASDLGAALAAEAALVALAASHPTLSFIQKAIER
jgi:hypothetical protein